MGAASAYLTGASGGLDLLSGIYGMDAANSRASLLKSQASLAVAESEAEAARYASEARSFKATQKMAYAKSGVKIDGSPLDVLDKTARTAAENISAIRAQGQAKAGALRAEAAGAKAQGRLALLKGVFSAATSTAKMGDKLGWWDKTEKTTEES
jgi:hypothetical protein